MGDFDEFMKEFIESVKSFIYITFIVILSLVFLYLSLILISSTGFLNIIGLILSFIGIILLIYALWLGKRRKFKTKEEEREYRLERARVLARRDYERPESKETTVIVKTEREPASLISPFELSPFWWDSKSAKQKKKKEIVK